MKILMPYIDQYDRPITHPIISGGIEMFCKSVNDNFETTVLQVPYYYVISKDCTAKEKKEMSRKIINHAENIGADIILVLDECSPYEVGKDYTANSMQLTHRWAKRSIKEFEQVFTFPGTNKADDAQFKLGLCYINNGQPDKAKIEFESLIEFYPNSEYYKRSQEYLNKF